MWSASSGTRFWTSLDQTALSTLKKSRAKIERAQSKLDRETRDGEAAKAQSRYEILEHEIRDVKAQNKELHEMLLLLGQQSRRLLVEWDLKQEMLINSSETSRRLTQHVMDHPSAGELDLQTVAESTHTALATTNSPFTATGAEEAIDRHKGMNILRASLEDHMHKITKLVGAISSPRD